MSDLLPAIADLIKAWFFIYGIISFIEDMKQKLR